MGTLTTGATGYAGSNVAEESRHAGHQEQYEFRYATLTKEGETVRPQVAAREEAGPRYYQFRYATLSEVAGAAQPQVTAIGKAGPRHYQFRYATLTSVD